MPGQGHRKKNTTLSCSESEAHCRCPADASGAACGPSQRLGAVWRAGGAWRSRAPEARARGAARESRRARLLFRGWRPLGLWASREPAGGLGKSLMPDKAPADVVCEVDACNDEQQRRNSKRRPTLDGWPSSTPSSRTGNRPARTARWCYPYFPWEPWPTRLVLPRSSTSSNRGTGRCTPTSS